MEYRPLSQDELLAEAARTELDNLRDLEQMVALEEATKKKALYKRSKYSGPMTRFHSKRVDDTALVSNEHPKQLDHSCAHALCGQTAGHVAMCLWQCTQLHNTTSCAYIQLSCSVVFTLFIS